METKVIELRGVERNSDIEVAKDGGAADLVNLRPREDGTLEPIGEPIVVGSLDGATPIFIHEVQLVQHVISLGRDKKTIFVSHSRNGFNGEFASCKLKSSSLLCLDEEIEVKNVNAHANGNVLTIEVKGHNETDVAHFLFFSQRGYVRQVFPTDIHLSATATNTTHTARFNSDSILKSSFNSFISATKAEALSKAMSSDAILFIAAARLFDGSYLHPSRIIEIRPDGNMKIGYQKRKDDKDLFVSIPCMSNIHIVVSPLLFGGADYTQYSLVQSIDLFAFRYDPLSIKPAKVSADGSEETEFEYLDIYKAFLSQVQNGGGPIEKEISPLIPHGGILSKANAFYLIASSDAKSNFEMRLHFDEDGNTENYQGENGGIKTKSPLFELPDRFIQNERLDWNSVIPQKKLSGNSYVFNSRTHLYNIEAFVDASELSMLHGDGMAYLELQNGDVVKVNHVHKTAGYIYTAIPGAKTIFLKQRIPGSTSLTYYSIFKLEKHKYLPISYSLHGVRGGIGDVLEFVNSIESRAKNSIRQDSIIKCSRPNNPIAFTSLLTYPVAGVAIGISSVSSAPDGYNFGNYPVYVFTTSGIYALMQGDGPVAYSACKYISPDVLSNKNALCQTPFGLAYSSAGHIYLMPSDGHRDKVSYDLERVTRDIQGDVLCHIYEMLTQEAKTDTSMPFEKESFGDFLDQAHIIYSHRTEDLIVHSDASHCLVYNMRSKRWCRRLVSILKSHRVGSQLLFSDRETPNFLFDWENKTLTNSTILLLTRPFSLGHIGYSRIGAVALRGLFLSSDIYPSFGGEKISFNGDIIHRNESLRAYLFASDDGITYNAIEVKIVQNLRDIMFSPPRSKSYRFFSVAVFGTVKNGTRINYIEIGTDKAYDNKLR